MAFNQLKKWVGTQLWSTFMTEYNENIDELNRVISDVDELNRVIAEMEANNSLFTYRQISVPDYSVPAGLKFKAVDCPTIPGYMPFYGIVRYAMHLESVMWCIHVESNGTVYAQSYAPTAHTTGVNILLWYIKTT